MRLDLASLVLRLGLGVTFVLHGGQKLFGWFGGAGLDATGESFAGMGLEPGGLWAVVAGVGELGGGALLVLGLLTPLGALSIAVSMVVAIATATGGGGFFSQDGGWEYNAVLILVAVAVLVLGPGRASLDARLGLADLPARLRARRGRAPVPA